MREPVVRQRTIKQKIRDSEVGPLDLEKFGALRGLSKKTIKNYSSDDKLPAPDGIHSGNPYWWESTALAFYASRPGSGYWGPRTREVAQSKALAREDALQGEV